MNTKLSVSLCADKDTLPTQSRHGSPAKGVSFRHFSAGYLPERFMENSVDPSNFTVCLNQSSLTPLIFDGDDNNTLSFDPKGVNPDPAPKGAICEETKGPQNNDNCIKREMKKCKNYNFTKNNCCHCVEEALKACGQSIPASKWPNYPINPGPQTGEPGYKP